MSRELSSNGAVFDDSGRYRYMLWRVWEMGGRFVTFVMLNPSTADASKDDNTIKSCTRMAKAWGYNGLIVVNLFAWRATKPKELLKTRHPIGPLSTLHILEAADLSEGRIVCAWGNHGVLFNRGFEVAEMLREKGYRLECLKITLAKQPIHPLYQAVSTSLVEYV